MAPNARRPRFFPAALLSLLGLVIAACPAQRVEERDVVDLVASFKTAAQVRQSTQIIEFGYPSARPFLVQGWHESFRELEVPPGRLATWSMGEGAEIEFFVVEPADIELTFRAALIRKNPEVRADVAFYLNGRHVKDLEFHDVLLLYNLTLPAGLVKKGENRLSFEHPPAPAAARDHDVRGLWDFLQFGPTPDPDRQLPFARADKDTLFIPFATRVDYHLKLPAHTALTVQECRSRAGATGRLRVAWQKVGGEDVVLAEDFCSLAGTSLPITGDAEESGRLSLFALAAEKVTERFAGILSYSPRLRTQAPPPPAPAPLPAAANAAGKRPNILLYLVDTLRADRLGCYGYERGTSPAIDAFAAEGTVFVHSQAQSPWTRASVASMLTGLWPQKHEVNDDEDQLSPDAVTLPELLQGVGYQTAAITTNGNSSRLAGFAQGFDYFNYLREIRLDDPFATSEDVNRAADAWLDQRAGDQRPFFLLLHTIDPHAPYSPPEPYRSRFAPGIADLSIGTPQALEKLNLQQEPITPERVAALSALYDAEVAYNDASFGALLASLARRGLDGDTIVVFLSDHGEEFAEHGGFSHGRSLYREMLDVPLIVRWPGLARGRRLEAIVEHVDLLPTLATAGGAQVPAGLQGHDFRPLLMAETPESWENWAVAHMNLRTKKATSFLNDQWKLIQLQRDAEDFYPELYSRVDDPTEQQNLAPTRPEIARMLSSARRAQEQAQAEGLRRQAIDDQAFDEVRKELEALGYVGNAPKKN